MSGADWPGVEWPPYDGAQDGQGDMGHFHIGVGGYCQHDLQDPIAGPTGYWCAMQPPRGQCWDKEKNAGSGCVQTHMSPDGVVFPRALAYATSARRLDARAGVMTSGVPPGGQLARVARASVAPRLVSPSGRFER